MCVTGRVVGLSRLFILPKQQNLTLTPVLHPTRHFDHVQQIFQWSEFQDSSRKTHFPDFVISKLYFNIIPTGNLFTYFAQRCIYKYKFPFFPGNIGLYVHLSFLYFGRIAYSLLPRLKHDPPRQAFTLKVVPNTFTLIP